VRSFRSSLAGAAILALALIAAPSQAGTITPSVNPDLILSPGDSLVLTGYGTVLVIVDDGILMGDELTFRSGGSIDFWAPPILNPPYIPVSIVSGNVVEFCASPQCGPYAGSGVFTVQVPSFVDDILIEAADQIIFKGIPTVPEPASALLLGGALTLFAIGRRVSHS